MVILRTTKLGKKMKRLMFYFVIVVFLQFVLILNNVSVVSLFSNPFYRLPVLQFWVEESDPSSNFHPLPVSEIKKFSLLSQQEKENNEFFEFDNVIHQKCFQALPANYSLQEYQNDYTNAPEKIMENHKKILVWNHRFGNYSLGFGYGDGPFKKGCCKETRCFLTGNSDLIPIEEFDAIIFHFYTLAPRNMPAKRSPHQRWIMYEMEAPAYNFHNPDDFAGIFNWTMTYRIDSDIPIRYGYTYPKEKSLLEANPTESTKSDFTTKKKLVAWLVSHCMTQSYREYYVKKLQQYIEIDIYGDCAEKSFPKDQNNFQSFYKTIEKNYKFYLSFENALCKDYVTEKFFNILRYKIVPVVYGFADYKSMAPPNSYIDILDFNSLKDVADYLLYLDRNSTAYEEYFRWKGDYEVVSFSDSGIISSIYFCSLCKLLHSNSPKKTYDKLREWHVQRAKCKRMRPVKWYERILGITLD